MPNRRRRKGRGRGGGGTQTPATHTKLHTNKSFKSANVKICLCMIVKNESKIIKRCLNAARPILDYVSIVDTGSTDNTKELVEEWCTKAEIPCVVHEEPFKNFSHNRTHSYRAAKEAFPDSAFFLLLDADMVLVVNPRFNKNELTENAYMIEQYSHVVRYWNLRLLGNKNIESWDCIGVTHEYWESTPSSDTKRLATLEIDDREDGGCKSDKYVRDRKLLLEGYNDPETPKGLKTRYSYYLGQTFECLGEHKSAIEWFSKRSEEKGTWEEEAWYAQYKSGMSYFFLGEDEKGVSTLLQAWDRRPWRAEPLYKLACYFRAKHPTPDQGTAMNHVSLMYALQAKEVPYPENDVLFVEYDVYDFLIDVEIAIVAFYVRGKKNMGKAAAKRLAQKLKEGKIKEKNRDHVKETIKFYGM